MIWFILGLFLWATLLFLIGPLISKETVFTNSNADVKAYSAEIDHMTEHGILNDLMLDARKIELQRTLLEVADEKPMTSTPISAFGVNALCAFILFGGLGLYAVLGSPKLTKAEALVAAPLSADQTVVDINPQVQWGKEASLAELVAELGRKLRGDQKNEPEGWILYARSLMKLRRYDDAFEAYAQVLRLTDNNAEVVAELERAKTLAKQFGQNESGPSQADIQAAQDMNEADRTAMIESMVESLASKLRANPDDETRWIRLLKSRKVLGQTQQAREDIRFMKKHYAERTGTIDKILRVSGWGGE